MSAENSLQKTGPNAIAVPDYIKGGAQGRENVEQEDLLLPRLRLSQRMSPWVGDGLAKAGDMTHSLDPKINWGKETRIVPVYFMKNRLRWTPRDETPPPDAPKGMECVSDKAVTAREVKGLDKAGNATATCKDCVYSDFHEGKPPRCTLYKTFVTLVGPNKTMMAVSMEKTKVKMADTILTLSTMLGDGSLPLYAGAYALGTKEIQNDKGEFFVYTVSADGFSTKDEYTLAESTYESVKSKRVTIDQDNPNAKGTGDGDTPF